MTLYHRECEALREAELNEVSFLIINLVNLCRYDLANCLVKWSEFGSRKFEPASNDIEFSNEMREIIDFVAAVNFFYLLYFVS